MTAKGGKREGAGRKPGQYDGASRSIRRQIGMPEDEWARLDEKARALGLTRSAFIRLLWSEYLKKF